MSKNAKQAVAMQLPNFGWLEKAHQFYYARAGEICAQILNSRKWCLCQISSNAWYILKKKFSELLLFYVLYNTNNLRKKREKAKTIEAGAAYLAILTAEKNQNYEEIHCKI